MMRVCVSQKPFARPEQEPYTAIDEQSIERPCMYVCMYVCVCVYA